MPASSQQHLPWNIIEAVERGAPRVLLYGPPGTGKTTSAYNAAKALGKPVYNITLSDETPAAELRGHFVPIGQEWKWMHGPAMLAYNEGAVLILDEIDKASQDALDFLHGLLNDPAVARITLPNGETCFPKEGFQVIATMNGELEDLPPALQDRFAIAIEVHDPHPDAIASLPKDLRSAAKKVEDYEAAERPATLRKWAAFAMLREIEEVGPMNAAKAVFAHRAGELMDAIKFKDKEGEGGIAMKVSTKAKKAKTKPATATMKANAKKIRAEDGFCDCEDCVEGRAWDWVGHAFGISLIEEKGGSYECPVCGAGHGEQLDAVNCCFVEDRWLLEGRKVGLV
jgi:MoxR-like ATPase